MAVLVHGYWDILVHRARLKLRTDADAEEVAAETVASAIASAFDGRSVGEFRSWLHTILSRRIADWWQKDERSVQVRPLPQPGDEEFAGHEPAVGFEGDAMHRPRVRAADARRAARRAPRGGAAVRARAARGGGGGSAGG